MPKTVLLTDLPASGGDRWALLRAGTFNSMQGPVEITPQHLEEIVSTYDQDVDEAAINLDHVRQGKNLGVISEVELSDGILYVRPALLDDAIASQVGKRLRRVSGEITFSHEVTGTAYLTGVALLGAAYPAVKGLPPIPPIQQPGGSMSTVQMTEPETPSANDPKPTSQAAPTPTRQASPVPAAPPAATETPPAAAADLAALRQANLDTTHELAEARRLRAEIAQERAALQVDKDLAQLGTRITPAMTKAGLPALLAHLATRTGTVQLAEGASAVSPYQAALAILSALPEAAIFADGLAQEELDGPERVALSDGEQALLAKFGIDDKRCKELDKKYGKGAN